MAATNKQCTAADASARLVQTPINVKFSDLTYEVMNGRKSSKTILHGVSGQFQAGTFTAIIGPSGCGKTTLLNILAGYRTQKTSGHISVNDKPLNAAHFRKTSRYVLQDDYVNPYFTVWETLHFTSRLKMDRNCTQTMREERINEILNTLQLSEQKSTMVSKLSGGQLKRLCVAVEILDQPSVLMLDEPTTGLDDYSANQCINVLKDLSTAGCTVICSIHTPPTRLLEKFDKIYALAKGQCVYQGPVQYIVPYLQEFQLECPLTYNPADFIIEVITQDDGQYLHDMVQKTQNGKSLKYLPNDMAKPIRQADIVRWDREMDTARHCPNKVNRSWLFEFQMILWRNLQQMWRDKIFIYFRIVAYIVLSCLAGLGYLGVGDNGILGWYNAHMCLITIVMCVFVSLPLMCAYIPQEMKYLRREHFNQWYRLSAYYIAVIVSQIPVSVIMALISSSIIYVLSAQPLQLFRFLLFFGTMSLTAMMVSCFGLLMGSLFNVLNSLFIGLNIMCVWVVFAGLTTNKDHLTLMETIVIKSSCVRHALEALMSALMKYNRPDITCPHTEIACAFSKPEFVLKICGSRDINYVRATICMLAFLLAFASLAFVCLKSRLTPFVCMQSNRHLRYFKFLVTKYLYIKMF